MSKKTILVLATLILAVFIVDNISATVTISNALPSNNTVASQTNVNLNASISSDVGISGVQLVVTARDNLSGGSSAQSWQFNYSGINGTYYFNYGVLSHTYNLWYFVINETNGSSTIGPTNYVIYNAPAMIVTLNSPFNNDFITNSSPTLSGFVSSNFNVKNVTLVLDGVWFLNQTNTSGLNNSNYYFFPSLSEGNHTWYYQACDVTGFCSASSTRNMMIDKTAPAITLLAPTNNQVNTTGNVFFIASITDISGINFNISLYGLNGTIPTKVYNYGSYQGWSGVYYVTHHIPDGTYQWYIYVCDNAGNCGNSSTRNLTISTGTSSSTSSSGSSSSGGGSSGGGGGGSSSGSSSVIIPQSKNTTANQPIVLNVTNSSTGITQVQIIANQSTSNASITVSSSSSSGQVASAGQTYQTFQISLGGLEETSIINVSIDFKVNKSWIDRNGKDPANVTLYRNTGTDSVPIWTNLLTNLTSQDVQYYYYRSISPGFSTYAVVVGNSSCDIGQARCLVNDLQQCSSSKTWETIKTCQNGCSMNSCVGEIQSLLAGANVYYFSIAAVVLLGGVVFFVIYKHHKKSQ